MPSATTCPALANASKLRRCASTQAVGSKGIVVLLGMPPLPRGWVLAGEAGTMPRRGKGRQGAGNPGEDWRAASQREKTVRDDKRKSPRRERQNHLYSANGKECCCIAAS